MDALVAWPAMIAYTVMGVVVLLLVLGQMSKVAFAVAALVLAGVWYNQDAKQEDYALAIARTDNAVKIANGNNQLVGWSNSDEDTSGGKFFRKGLSAQDNYGVFNFSQELSVTWRDEQPVKLYLTKYKVGGNGNTLYLLNSGVAQYWLQAKYANGNVETVGLVGGLYSEATANAPDLELPVSMYDSLKMNPYAAWNFISDNNIRW